MEERQESKDSPRAPSSSASFEESGYNTCITQIYKLYLLLYLAVHIFFSLLGARAKRQEASLPTKPTSHGQVRSSQAEYESCRDSQRGYKNHAETQTDSSRREWRGRRRQKLGTPRSEGICGFQRPARSQSVITGGLCERETGSQCRSVACERADVSFRAKTTSHEPSLTSTISNSPDED